MTSIGIIIAGYIAGAFIGALIAVALWRPLLYIWGLRS